MDNEQSSSLIKDVHCGVVAPGMSVTKTLHLLSSGAAGDRVLDISVQTRIPEVIAEDQEHRVNDVTETLQTIVVPTLEAFQVMQEVTYQHSLKGWGGLADLASYDEDYEDEGRGAEAMVMTDVSIAGPWSVYVEHIGLEDEVSMRAFLYPGRFVEQQ